MIATEKRDAERWCMALWFMSIVPVACLLAIVPGGVWNWLLVTCGVIHYLGCRWTARLIAPSGCDNDQVRRKEIEMARKFAVIEVLGGEFHSGFKTQRDAEAYVAHRQCEYDIDEEYHFRVVEVLSEIDQVDDA